MLWEVLHWSAQILQTQQGRDKKLANTIEFILGPGMREWKNAKPLAWLLASAGSVVDDCEMGLGSYTGGRPVFAFQSRHWV